MTCSNCGRPLHDNSRFCPHCGSVVKLPNAGSYTVPLYPEGSGNPTVPVNRPPQRNPVAPVRPQRQQAEKQGRKPMKTVISVVAVILALALTASALLIFKPGPLGYAKDNTFASHMTKTKRGSASRDVMTVFAALHNTLFNSKSFTLKGVGIQGQSVNASLVFGKDLSSSKALMTDDNEYVALQDGRLIVTDKEDWARRLNVQNLLDDYENCLDAFPRDGMSEKQRAFLDEESDTIKNSLDNLIRNKLVFNSVDQLFGVYFRLIDLTGQEIQQGDYNSPVVFDNITLSGALDILADYIVQMPDDLVDIESKRQDGAVKYTYSIKIRDLLLDFIDFLLESDKAADLLTSRGKEELKETRDEVKENYSSKGYIKGEAVIKSKYVTKLTVGFKIDDGYNEAKFTFSDINKMKIDDAKLKKVFDAVDKEDMIIIENVDDLEDYIEEQNNTKTSYDDDEDDEYDEYDYY